MAGKLKARCSLFIVSGGYQGEDHGGTTPSLQNWFTAEESDSVTTGYYFRDSTTRTDANSSRVVTEITDSWSYTVDENNVATVTLTAVIKRIYRDDVRGDVSTLSGGRNMRIWDRKGGTLLFNVNSDPISTAHTIMSNPIQVVTKTFTVAPGGHTSVNDSIYLRSNVEGHDGDATPSEYVDECAIGIEFLNDLPVDYRPGKIWNGTEWLSHNRSGGAANIAINGGASSKTMRTTNGGVDSDNSPFINHPTDTMTARYKNMRKVGRE